MNRSGKAEPLRGKAARRSRKAEPLRGMAGRPSDPGARLSTDFTDYTDSTIRLRGRAASFEDRSTIQRICVTALSRSAFHLCNLCNLWMTSAAKRNWLCFVIFIFGAAGGRIAGRIRAWRSSAEAADCEISCRNDSLCGATPAVGPPQRSVICARWQDILLCSPFGHNSRKGIVFDSYFTYNVS
jgi:hypothetical protein